MILIKKKTHLILILTICSLLFLFFNTATACAQETTSFSLTFKDAASTIQNNAPPMNTAEVKTIPTISNERKAVSLSNSRLPITGEVSKSAFGLIGVFIFLLSLLGFYGINARRSRKW